MMLKISVRQTDSQIDIEGIIRYSPFKYGNRLIHKNFSFSLYLRNRSFCGKKTKRYHHADNGHDRNDRTNGDQINGRRRLGWYGLLVFSFYLRIYRNLHMQGEQPDNHKPYESIGKIKVDGGVQKQHH